MFDNSNNSNADLFKETMQSIENSSATTDCANGKYLISAIEAFKYLFKSKLNLTNLKTTNEISLANTNTLNILSIHLPATNPVANYEFYISNKENINDDYLQQSIEKDIYNQCILKYIL
jgi:hypothetical protein